MMSDDLTEESRARPSMGVPASLWVGLLLPPIVWALQMQLNYWAVRGACVRGSNLRLYAVTAIALLLIFFSGLCAWIGARRLAEDRRVEWGAVVSNSRFMFTLGILSCAIFLIAVVAQAIAAIVLHPCQL
jgi:hypothetical protein